jgi:hypothetical protein
MTSKMFSVVGIFVWLVFLASSLSAQSVTLRYGQIPSSIKTVSAIQFVIGQRKNLFEREASN